MAHLPPGGLAGSGFSDAQDSWVARVYWFEDGNHNMRLLFCLAVLTGIVPASAADAKADAFGRLPAVFERNEGQSPREVRYSSRAGRYTLFLTETEAVLAPT